MRDTNSMRHITVFLDLIFFSRSTVTWFSLNTDMTRVEQGRTCLASRNQVCLKMVLLTDPWWPILTFDLTNCFLKKINSSSSKRHFTFNIFWRNTDSSPSIFCINLLNSYAVNRLLNQTRTKYAQCSTGHNCFARVFSHHPYAIAPSCPWHPSLKSPRPSHRGTANPPSSTVPWHSPASWPQRGFMRNAHFYLQSKDSSHSFLEKPYVLPEHSHGNTAPKFTEY